MGNIYRDLPTVISSTQPCLLVNLLGQDINGVQVMPADQVLTTCRPMFAVTQSGNALA